MSEWKQKRGVGKFFFQVPTKGQLLHSQEAQQRALDAMILDDDAAEFEMDDEPHFGAVSIEETISYPVWWYDEDGCYGEEMCRCGRSTLLDALTHIEEELRADAVREHVRVMRSMYDHFWSGQGLLEGGAQELGEACALCLTVGASHVWDIYESASEAAEELGEAMSAYEFSLTFGDPRFRPGDDSGKTLN